MAPHTRRRTAAESATAVVKQLPSLPDDCWGLVMSRFTENSDFFGMALVCRRFRRLVRDHRMLDQTAFMWDDKAGTTGVNRAQLFGRWLCGRAGLPLVSLELHLLPPPSQTMPTSFKYGLWRSLRLLAPQLRHLHIMSNSGLLANVSGWAGGLSQLRSLMLHTLGSGMTVCASLAGLTHLTALTLRARLEDEDNLLMSEEGVYGMAFAAGIRLEWPEDIAWLPTSLSTLCLECPTLAGLPHCLPQLTSLRALSLSGRQAIPNEHLTERLLPLAPGLVHLDMHGSLEPAFVPRLAAFTGLTALQLFKTPLRSSPTIEGLEEVLQALTRLQQLTLRDVELPALPAPVAALPHCKILDVSKNPAIAHLPPGAYWHGLRYLAADWQAMEGTAADTLAHGTRVKELCLVEFPTDAAKLAAVLRRLPRLPKLEVLYFDLDPDDGMDHAVLVATAELARALPALQLKNVIDCLW